uniref:Uncharacterized protein n=1 Tax=Anguilla anguilla TaxID=7936 RepID=A0A0E9SJJ2_ANGAN
MTPNGTMLYSYTVYHPNYLHLNMLNSKLIIFSL